MYLVGGVLLSTLILWNANFTLFYGNFWLARMGSFLIPADEHETIASII